MTQLLWTNSPEVTEGTENSSDCTKLGTDGSAHLIATQENRYVQQINSSPK